MFSSLYKYSIFVLVLLLITVVNLIPTKGYCNLKIALFGDSLMAGYGLKEEFHLSTVLEKNLNEKGFNVEIINASVSGDTTNGGLKRLSWLLEKREIDILILCLGANDMLRGLEPNHVRTNLEKMLEILKEKKINILLAGMQSQGAYGKEYKENFDKIFPELAKKFGLAFLPFLLEGIALKPEYNLSDGKHPNQLGVNLMSKNLEKELIKILIDKNLKL